MKRIVFALFLILIVTIINFYGDNIYYDYKIYKFRENYKGVNYNKYQYSSNTNSNLTDISNLEKFSSNIKNTIK